MKQYRHIFFDLDRTLWDFDRSSHETAAMLYEKYDLRSKGIPDFEVFYEKYTAVNLDLWEIYRQGKIEKDELNIERFYQTMLYYGFDDRLVAAHFASDYISVSPTGDYLYPHAKEMLEYMHKKYPLHIITNGFEEVQQTKINRNKLEKYFRTVTTSEMAGVKKPEPGIFQLAMKKAGAEASESLMIGDDVEVDLMGAKNVGMDQMLVTFNGLDCDFCQYRVSSLREIMRLL